jgi:hypothetical protein
MWGKGPVALGGYTRLSASFTVTSPPRYPRRATALYPGTISADTKSLLRLDMIALFGIRVEKELSQEQGWHFKIFGICRYWKWGNIIDALITDDS